MPPFEDLDSARYNELERRLLREQDAGDRLAREEKEKTRENIEGYYSLLDKYKKLFDQIGILKRLFKEQSEIESVDRERHQIHLKLLEAGSKIDKNEEAVLIDIIRKQGSLAEYGLPEFSILPSWKGDSNSNKCFLMYSISEVVSSDEEKGTFELAVPDDYRVLRARAEALAEKIHGELYEDFDSEYFHSVSLRYLGVRIPTGNLEEAVETIRNAPEKYRIGEQFYSTQEKKLVEELKFEKKGGVIEVNSNDNHV